MSLNLKKIISSGLTFIFLAQVALGSVAESNFWTDRRKATVQNDSPDPQAQLASLPEAQQNPQVILKQLPSIGATLPQVPKWTDTNRKVARGLSKSLQSLLNSIPLTYDLSRKRMTRATRKYPQLCWFRMST